MTTFVLVHGAWHGSSCWAPTAARLHDLGHDTVTVDLPCDNPAARLVDYATTVLEALAPTTSDDIVLVGHSLGGVTVPLVAAARPVREMVMLCAMVPTPGMALTEDVLAQPDTFADGWAGRAVHQLRHDDGTTSWPLDAAVDAFYHDCPPDLAARAAADLRRQSWTIADEPHPLAAYPGVPARAIVCTEDRVLNAEACARHASERLGASVVRLAGGHSPMLAQPDALVDALVARP